MLEEVVRARDYVVVDRDVLLRAQLVDQLLHRARRDDFVGVALDDDARGRAGREEGEIVHVGGRRHRSEEHTSELQSLMRISYAVFCLKKTIVQLPYFYQSTVRCIYR